MVVLLSLSSDEWVRLIVVVVFDGNEFSIIVDHHSSNVSITLLHCEYTLLIGLFSGLFHFCLLFDYWDLIIVLLFMLFLSLMVVTLHQNRFVLIMILLPYILSHLFHLNLRCILFLNGGILLNIVLLFL